MSAQAATVPRRGISLDSRLRATARSEWIKFRSVRSGPFALVATALTVVAGARALVRGRRIGCGIVPHPCPDPLSRHRPGSPRGQEVRRKWCLDSITFD